MMNFVNAMKAAKQAKDEGLSGIYPLALQVLSDELQEILKNTDKVIKLEVLKEREACAALCKELYANDGITCAEFIMERD